MASYGTTAKWALRYLLGGSDVNEIDDGFQSLASDIDVKLTPYDEGLLAARPVSTPGTPGIKGRQYRATDDPAGGPNGMVYLDYGTGWLPVTAGQPLVPTGTVLMTAAAAADTGFLLCDGSAILRATYPDLFGRIGTIHGAGNGSTTFNLPDLRGRAPVGAGTAAGAAGATAHALGDKGGEETHALTTAELASHSHTSGAGGNGKTGTENSSLSHAHIFNLPAPGRTGGGAWVAVAEPGGGVGNIAATTGAISDVNGVQSNAPAAHDHNVTINSSGGGGSHNNMQPYAAVNFQIKT